MQGGEAGDGARGNLLAGVEDGGGQLRRRRIPQLARRVAVHAIARPVQAVRPRCLHPCRRAGRTRFTRLSTAAREAGRHAPRASARAARARRALRPAPPDAALQPQLRPRGRRRGADAARGLVDVEAEAHGHQADVNLPTLAGPEAAEDVLGQRQGRLEAEARRALRPVRNLPRGRVVAQCDAHVYDNLRQGTARDEPQRFLRREPRAPRDAAAASDLRDEVLWIQLVRQRGARHRELASEDVARADQREGRAVFFLEVHPRHGARGLEALVRHAPRRQLGRVPGRARLPWRRLPWRWLPWCRRPRCRLPLRLLCQLPFRLGHRHWRPSLDGSDGATLLQEPTSWPEHHGGSGRRRHRRMRCLGDGWPRHRRADCVLRRCHHGDDGLLLWGDGWRRPLRRHDGHRPRRRHRAD
mmetsp:Transcript_5967/g.17238  ORF Transcript_5967/g.17238 Transcript_5967/m.17238 type:complete len:413 (-) Transcript_5967:570-1808(-)